MGVLSTRVAHRPWSHVLYLFALLWPSNSVPFVTLCKTGYFFCNPEIISHTELSILLNKSHHRINTFKKAVGATHVDHTLAMFTPTSRLPGRLFFQKDTLFKTINQKASYPGG